MVLNFLERENEHCREQWPNGNNLFPAHLDFPGVQVRVSSGSAVTPPRNVGLEEDVASSVREPFAPGGQWDVCLFFITNQA